MNLLFNSPLKRILIKISLTSFMVSILIRTISETVFHTHAIPILLAAFFSIILTVSYISISISLLLLFLLFMFEDVKSRKLRSLFLKLTVIAIIAWLILETCNKLSNYYFNYRPPVRCAQVFHEMRAHGYSFDSFHDSLSQAETLQEVQENYTLEILSNSSGDSAWYFKPIPDSKAQFGICIEENGTIHEFIHKPIATIEECRESRSRYIVDSILHK